MEWSPLVIENYVNGWLTSTGAFVAGSVDGLIKANEAPANTGTKHLLSEGFSNRLINGRKVLITILKQ